MSPQARVVQPASAGADRSLADLNTESVEQSLTDVTAVASLVPAKFVAPINNAEQAPIAQTALLEYRVSLADTSNDLPEQAQAISSEQEAALAEGDRLGEDDINVSAATNQSDDDNAPPSFALGSNSNPKPKYPYIAQKRGWQGDVLLGVDVKQDGWPQRVTVLESSGFGLLDKAAVATIRDYWQFEPALSFRRPVEGYTQVPISFRLN